MPDPHTNSILREVIHLSFLKCTVSRPWLYIGKAVPFPSWTTLGEPKVAFLIPSYPPALSARPLEASHFPLHNSVVMPCPP